MEGRRKWRMVLEQGRNVKPEESVDNDLIKNLYLESLDENQEFCYQRFARLIVEECAEFSKQYLFDEAACSYRIHQAIRQHFKIK